MAEDKKESKASRRGNPSSKLPETILVILAAFLTFAGPTYVVYAMNDILEIDYAISVISGFVIFIIGLMLIWRLIRNKIVT